MQVKLDPSLPGVPLLLPDLSPATLPDKNGAPVLSGPSRQPRTFRKMILLASLIFLLPTLLMASHFRYGTISWQRGTGNTVTFRIQQAWRMSFYFSGTPTVGETTVTGGFAFGDGTIGTINLTVTSVNAAEDWFYGEATLTHTYPSSGTFTAYFDDCCRIGTLQNNANESYTVATRVNLGTANSSPVSTLVPIIDVPANNAAATFNINASDPNGNPLTYRFATASEAGVGFVQPAGLSINATTGQMTFNTVGKTIGQLYSTQVKISDGTAEVPLDFIIRISNTTGTAPYFVSPPTPFNGQVFSVMAGSPVTFGVRAQDNDAGNTVSLSAAGVPVGAAFNPPLPATGNPANTTFSWTPNASALGTHVINFNAIDNTGRTANRSVTIHVVLATTFYSKATGDLHNLATWGTNTDGSGPSPSDFGIGKSFILANRGTMYTMTNNWALLGRLEIPAGSQLRLNGHTLSIENLTHFGTITGSPTSSIVAAAIDPGAIFLYFTPGTAQLKNLTVNMAGVGTPYLVDVVNADLEIYGVLDVKSGPFGAFPGFKVILKSTPAGTARVAPVGGTISAPVVVERYIPARRAWRMLNAPVNNSQTVNAAFQEGATTASPNPNPYPGYGTHITGGPGVGTVTNGFDQHPGSQSSIKTYNTATQMWQPLPNTNMTAVGNTPFMLFIRGHRGTPLGLNTVPPTVTTLRAMGRLNIGDFSVPISAMGFTAVPNPYMSPVNFATVTKTHVQNSFYVWDPKLGGANGVGGYVNVSWNGTSYDVTPAAVSPISHIIQPWQSILVRSTGMAGTLTFKESDKSATPDQNVFRTAPNKGLRINLQAMGQTGETALMDETYLSLSARFSDRIDAMDAEKLPNIGENIAIVRNGQSLMVDRRTLITEGDATQLRLWNLEAKTYLLRFRPEQLAAANVDAYLEDAFLRTATPISLDRESEIPFTVTADPASRSEERFRVIYTARGVRPVVVTGAGQPAILAYPNPLAGSTLTLHLVNQERGNYQVTITNSIGQVVYRKSIQHSGGSNTESLELANRLSKGIYQVSVKGAKGATTLSLVSQ